MVSILIATWNRADLLRTTLESLERLVIPPGLECEVVVVNNASTDNTPAVLEAYSGRIPLRTVFEPEPGLARARNAGAAASKGDLVLVTDDDVVVDPMWLSAMADGVSKLSADVAYGRIVPLWEKQPPSWYSKLLGPEFGALDHGSELRRVPVDTAGFGANHAFTRKAFDLLGGYDVSLGLNHAGIGGNEDEDFFRRAHESGLVVAYCPDAVLNHFVPEHRATKKYLLDCYRRGAPDHLEMLRRAAPTGRSLFGFPVYFLSIQPTFFWKWIKALLTRRRGDAFYYELRLRRFARLVRLALMRRRSGPDDVRSTQAV